MQEELERRNEELGREVQQLYNQMTRQGRSLVEIGQATDAVWARLYEGIPDGLHYYGFRMSVDHPSSPDAIIEWFTEEIKEQLESESDVEGIEFVRMLHVPPKNEYDVIYKSKKPLLAEKQRMLPEYIVNSDDDCNRPLDGECMSAYVERQLEQDEIEEVRQRKKEKKGTAEIAVKKNMPVGMFSKEVGKYLGGKKRKTQRKWKMPRKMTRKYCKKTPCKKMGFTQRSSCRPYKNCF